MFYPLLMHGQNSIVYSNTRTNNNIHPLQTVCITNAHFLTSFCISTREMYTSYIFVYIWYINSRYLKCIQTYYNANINYVIMPVLGEFHSAVWGQTYIRVYNMCDSVRRPRRLWCLGSWPPGMGMWPRNVCALCVLVWSRNCGCMIGSGANGVADWAYTLWYSQSVDWSRHNRGGQRSIA